MSSSIKNRQPLDHLQTTNGLPISKSIIDDDGVDFHDHNGAVVDVAGMKQKNRSYRKANKQQCFGLACPSFMQHRSRYVVLVLGSLAIASICSNMITFNFTMICMGKVPDEKTPNATRGTYDYTQYERSVLMWSVATGTLLAAWPFHWLYTKFGARIVFFMAGVLSTVATALVPMVAHRFPVFMVIRVIQGIAFGADFAAIGLITVNWASLKQHGFFISLLTSFSQLSVMFTMPVAGELCVSRFGWPMVYYVHALYSGILFTLWLIFYRDNPEKHPTVSDVELEKIRRDKEVAMMDDTIKTPYKAILMNPVMWTVWFAAFGELMSSQFIVLYAPSYLNEVLGFGVAHTGYFVALPRFIHLVFKIIAGISSDRIKFISERIKMIIYNTIALTISGVFFCVLGFIPKEHAYMALAIILVIEVTTGFICGGFYKCGTLVARQYSHFVLSQIQFIKCLSLFIEPLLVALIVRENTLLQWRMIFIIHGSVLIAGNFAFCIYATDKPASFTHIVQRTNEDDDNIDTIDTNRKVQNGTGKH